MKILITGAAGSLGGHLTRYFSNKSHTVIATGRDKTPPENLLKYATYIQADITEACSFPDVDVCIHTAALSDDKASKSELYTPNVIGTSNVLKATKSCSTFIHISSSSVYLPDKNVLPETIAGKQNNKELSLYGSSKLQSEEVVINEYTQNKCFILRPRALYGAGDKMILPRLLKLEKKGKLVYPGSLEVNISMTHYDNLALAIEKCLESNKKGLNIYNVADIKSYLLIDVLRNISSKLYGFTLPEKQIPLIILKTMAFFKIGGITKLLIRSFTQDMVLDISKIEKELNYSPVKNLNNSLDEISDWVENIGGIQEIKTGNKYLSWK